MEKVIQLDKLDQLEFLLHQSMKGIHLLFENRDIARVLSRPKAKQTKEFSMNKLKKMQALLADFIAQESLQDKIDYMNSLDEKTFELLVETYFNLLENSVKEVKVLH
tara:strand:+ start:9128 stop:9448 length:321 start_codon:yes stop_codon:yes gene_type:complete